MTIEIEAMKLVDIVLAQCSGYTSGPGHVAAEQARKVRDAIKAKDRPEPVRCPEKLKPGGCQLHNLHCGWPRCNDPR